MSNKISFLVLVACSLQFASDTAIASRGREFDYESTEFTKMITLEKWVSPQYLGDKEQMKEIQKRVAAFVPQNSFSRNFVKPVHNDEGEIRYFGKTFHTLAGAELPFLQFVNRISQKKQVDVIEIGAGGGFVSWKVPLAFTREGTHYANDLSHSMLNNQFEQITEACLEGIKLPHLRQRIVKLPGDCLTVLQEDTFKEKFDAIYVQNVEHFFNPNQHQQFLSLVSQILKPEGKAFLCAHSFLFGMEVNNPLFKLYNERKKMGDRYPGFATYTGEFIQAKGTEISLGRRIFTAIRPDDNTICNKEDEGTPRDGKLFDFPGLGKVQERNLKQKVTNNAFSPDIYRNAVAQHPTLEVLDAFFMNPEGDREPKWNGDVSHAAAIIKKKAAQVDEVTEDLSTLSLSQNP